MVEREKPRSNRGSEQVSAGSPQPSYVPSPPLSRTSSQASKTAGAKSQNISTSRQTPSRTSSCATAEGPVGPKPTPVFSRTSSQATNRSVPKGRRQRKTTFRHINSRSSSCATIDGPAGLKTTPVLSRTSSQATDRAILDGDTRVEGSASRQSHSRSSSRATGNHVAGPRSAEFHTIRRADTGLQQERETGPSSIQTLLQPLLKPCLNRRSQDQAHEEDDGIVTLNVEKPGPWVVDHHIWGLIQEIKVPTEGLYRRILNRIKPLQTARLVDKQPERTFRVSFAEMQRMHLRKLQIVLAKHAVTMYSTKDESLRWEEDLAAYIQAMKDYDYMVECSKRPRDNFLVTGERNIDYCVTRRVIKHVLKSEKRLDGVKTTRPVGPWEYDGTPIGGTRSSTAEAMSLQDFRDRLFLATAGAILLLGPMWLMVLHKTLYTGLVTTTVCVSIFGLVCVFRLDKPMDVLSATAAYAAVLVVFVGLTT